MLCNVPPDLEQSPLSYSTSTSVIGRSSDTDATRLRLFYDGRSSYATTESTPVGSQRSMFLHFSVISTGFEFCSELSSVLLSSSTAA